MGAAPLRELGERPYFTAKICCDRRDWGLSRARCPAGSLLVRNWRLFLCFNFSLNKAIRDFFGSLDRHKATKALFVTTSTFSPNAKETAEFLSKRIVLIDGDQLAALMVQQNIGCRIEDTLRIKKTDEEFFEA
jgi:hypothetical protein